MKKLFSFMILASGIFKISFAQNTFPSTGAVGIGTTTPNGSSLLEVKSSTKGVLFPRMTKDQRDAIGSPAQGLLIYQTNSTPGFYYYDGGWSAISAKGWKLAGNSGTKGSDFLGTSDNKSLRIRTNNIERVVFDSLGNVGIGTTSPKEKFHVNGTGNLARFGTGTKSTTYNYWWTGNDVGSFIEQQGNTATPGSDKFRIQSSKSGLHDDYSQFIFDRGNFQAERPVLLIQSYYSKMIDNSQETISNLQPPSSTHQSSAAAPELT